MFTNARNRGQIAFITVNDWPSETIRILIAYNALDPLNL